MEPTLRFCRISPTIAVLLLGARTLSAQLPAHLGWPTYGGDPGGQRYTESSQINAHNVSSLAPVWTFHTGYIAKNREGTKNSSFEATPILFHGLLYLTTPYDEIFALDPATGVERWQFDPKLVRNMNVGILTSRGVAAWASGTAAPHSICATRIFVATFDTRLIAVDAATGKVCTGFGEQGSVDLSKNVHFREDAAFYNSSPPTVIGNVVVVGSGIVDNTRVDLEDGVVRAFDCVTGKLVWAWEPIPWARSQRLPTGAANAWSVISADPEHGLVYVPTGAASPDFYGGTRPGDDRDANSVVALDAATGRRVWGFQVVHHDLWDYDVAAEPLLFTFRGASGRQQIPAVAITTKQGLIFVLNRLTGEPLYPIEERPVPASDVPGETAWPTQPFQQIASLSPISIAAGAMLGADKQDDIECRALFSNLRSEGIYTPPSLQGSLVFPGNIGGVNWGSAAIDPNTGILYANTNRYAFSIRFIPRTISHPLRFRLISRLNHAKRKVGLVVAFVFLLVVLTVHVLRRRTLRPDGFTLLVSVAGLALIAVSVVLLGESLTRRGYLYVAPEGPVTAASAQHFGREVGEQIGTPYTVLRQQIVAPSSKHPCTPLPWGTVSAVNLNTAKGVWQTPLGTVIPGRQTGTINLGGDIVTATGLLFTGASEEPYLRAFDSASGRELWKGRLPVPAQATPMSYTFNGRQYVVIAAGGHGLFGTPISDAVVAFALR